MIKSIGAKIYATVVHRKNLKWIKYPFEAQKKVFERLLSEGTKTRFGKEHDFIKI